MEPFWKNDSVADRIPGVESKSDRTSMKRQGENVFLLNKKSNSRVS